VVKDLVHNSKLLRAELGLTDDQSWREWLQSTAFKPMWTKLWEYLITQPKKKTGVRGVGLHDVLSVAAFRRDEFIGPDSDKTDWTEIDHLAQFMWHTVYRNQNTADGLFYRKNVTKQNAEILIWAVLKWVQHLHAPSQINRPSGGLAIMSQPYIEKPRRNIKPPEQGDTPRKKVVKGKSRKAIKVDLKKGSESENPFTDLPESSNPSLGSPGGVKRRRLDDSDTIHGLGTDITWDEKETADEANQVLALVASKKWKDMVIKPTLRLRLERRNEFDITDPYWQMRFFKTALSLSNQDVDNEAHPPENEDIEVVDSDDDQHSDADTEDKKTAEPDAFRTFTHLIAEDLAWAQISTEDYADNQTVPENSISITPQKLDDFIRQQAWLDNKDYQRDNFEEACAYLNIPAIENPRHELMRPSIELKSWQVVGIAALIEMRHKHRSGDRDRLLLNGAFLADVVGLGKTFVAAGYILEVCRR
jgi:hypothetical protein